MLRLLLLVLVRLLVRHRVERCSIKMQRRQAWPVVLMVLLPVLELLLLRAEVRASLVLRQPVEAWPCSCCVARPSLALVHEEVHLVERGHVW